MSALHAHTPRLRLLAGHQRGFDFVHGVLTVACTTSVFLLVGAECSRAHGSIQVPACIQSLIGLVPCNMLLSDICQVRIKQASLSDASRRHVPINVPIMRQKQVSKQESACMAPPAPGCQQAPGFARLRASRSTCAAPAEAMAKKSASPPSSGCRPAITALASSPYTWRMCIRMIGTPCAGSTRIRVW